jgi:uncharacterized protein (DUF1501 family)
MALTRLQLRHALFGALDPTAGSSDELLVVVFIRGGWDALNLVTPLTGPDRAVYEASRPTLALPTTGPRALLPLDDRFGLHPSAKPLHALYSSGRLAIVHAAGLAADTRSHFDAQAMIEAGVTAKPSDQICVSSGTTAGSRPAETARNTSRRRCASAAQ